MVPDQEVRENYRKASEDVAYLKKLDEYDLNQVYRYAEGCWQEHHKRAVAMYLVNVDHNYPEEYRGNEIDYWLDHEWQTQKCKRVRQEIERLRNLTEAEKLSPEQQIINWEYPLRQLIYVATNYVYSQNEDGILNLALMGSQLFDKGRGLFEAFKIGLKKQLSATSKEGRDIIGIDIADRFLDGIRLYYQWYSDNAEYRAYFGQNSRYEELMNLAQSTEREIVKYFPEYANSNTDTPSTSTPPPPNKTIESGFSTYIIEKYQAILLPYLISIYTNKRPREITVMLYALERLGVLTCKVAEFDQTNLHNTLTYSFGNIGVRTALNNALLIYSSDSIDSTKRQKVEQHKQMIEAFLKSDKYQ